MTEETSKPFDPLRRFSVWSRKTGLSRKVAFTLAGASLASGLATLVSMAGTGPEAMNPDVVLSLLYLDVILLLGLGAIIARRLIIIWLERKKGVAGSKLHTRFLLMFSLVAVTPSIMVAVFAGFFLNFGIQAWFSDKVFTAVMESREVVRAYLHEHRKAIKADVLAVAADINNNAPRLMQSPYEMSRFLDTVGAIRTLPELVILDRSGKVIARSSLSFSLEFDLVPPGALEQAQSGEVVTLTGKTRTESGRLSVWIVLSIPICWSGGSLIRRFSTTLNARKGRLNDTRISKKNGKAFKSPL